MPVRPATSLALLGALLLLLTGCAGSSGAPQAPPAPAGVVLPKYQDPRPLLTDVDNRMYTDGGTRLTLSGTLLGVAGSPVPVHGEGAARFDRAAGHAGPSVRLDVRSGEARTATGLVRTPARTWVRPAGSRWLRAGADPMPVGSEATVAANAGAAADPLADVSRYADATFVADAADEPVEGVPAVHYTLVVDLVRAVAAERDPARRATLQAQQRAGLTRISGEIWLDAERRPVQARIRRALPDTGTLDLVARYRGWGEPVVVEAPAQG